MAQIEQSGGWSTRQVILGVVLSVLTAMIMMLGHMLTGFSTWMTLYFSGGVGILLGAPTYMLLMRKVDRFGAFALFTTLLSCAFLLRGSTFLIYVPIYLVSGLILERLFLRTGTARHSFFRLSLNWTVFGALYLCSTFIAVLKDVKGYIELMRQMGMNSQDIALFEKVYYDPKQVLLIILITASMAWLGTLIGRLMMRRHFERSGSL